MIFDIVETARVFATAAHTAVGQRRKYSGEHYIHHPAAVVEIVSSVPHTPEMLAAAWLHDVVEDTGVCLDLISSEFGTAVELLVGFLTDVSKPDDGNRAARKAIDREHTAQASPAAKTIKLADLIDNTRSIVAHDPDFARVYLKEKALLLEVLRDGDATLWAMADEMVTLGMMRVVP
jgi:(p)ppGpp synthase/HD superfamily hydrolase